MKLAQIGLLVGLLLLTACDQPSANAQGGSGTIEAINIRTGRSTDLASTANRVLILSAPIRVVAAVVAMAYQRSGDRV